MRYHLGVCLFLCLSSMLYGNNQEETPLSKEDAHFAGVVAPPLTLSPVLPIEIDAKNRAQLLQNGAVDGKEAARNQAIKQATTFPWQAIALTLLFAFFVFAVIMTQRKSGKREESPEKMAQDARTKALDTLNRLDPESSYEVHYSTITDAIRHYIEECFHIKAAHMTTEEFLQAMASNPMFDLTMRQSLASFLEKADRVKFARHIPSDVERKAAFEAAIRFVG